MIALRTYCKFSFLSLLFSPLLTQELVGHIPDLQTIQIEWNDEAREENLSLKWCPLKYLHGSKKPLLLVKTNERGIFCFSISSKALTEWKTQKDLDGAFVKKIKSERSSLEQSALRSFLFSKKLRELDGLDIAFEGYKIEQKRFDTFFDEIITLKETINENKNNYKKKYPKSAALPF